MTGMGRHKAKDRDYHKTDEVLINGALRCHVFWNKVRMTSCQVTDPMPYSLFNCNICFIHMAPNLRGNRGEKWRKKLRWQECSLSLIMNHLCRPRDTEPGGALLGDTWAQCAVLLMPSHWPQVVQNHTFLIHGPRSYILNDYQPLLTS